MLRLLIAVAVVAAMAGAYDFTGGDALAGPGLAHAMAAGTLTIDVRSFAMGFVAALMLATVQRVPWHEFPLRMRIWMSSGKRLIKFLLLAALLLWVVMYY